MMYARSFRYKVPSGKAQRCLSIIEEMAARYREIMGSELRRTLLAREEGGTTLFEETYFFESWDEWRELMEKSKGDGRLSELWDEFEELLEGGEVFEEEWGFAQIVC